MYSIILFELSKQSKNTIGKIVSGTIGLGAAGIIGLNVYSDYKDVIRNTRNIKYSKAPFVDGNGNFYSNYDDAIQNNMNEY